MKQLRRNKEKLIKTTELLYDDKYLEIYEYSPKGFVDEYILRLKKRDRVYKQLVGKNCWYYQQFFR